MQGSSYQSGFGSYFECEAETGALPKGQNSPRNPAYGLYAEQINGSAFTAPRSSNLRSWLYKIRPSVVHRRFVPARLEGWQTPPFANNGNGISPQQMRWDPYPLPTSDQKVTLFESLQTWLGNGDPEGRSGAAIHLYAANAAKDDEFFVNADGEMLFLPQLGELAVDTEMGYLEASPGFLLVIPRGIKFRVKLLSEPVRGYLAENFGAPMRLPELGPIGANGLANPRDFEYPQAKYWDEKASFELLCKYGGRFWRSALDANPLDVVAWHGNYAPYRYDMARFNTIGTVSYDHPDPSIFTVLSSPSALQGVANLDFVIFPPRWMVAEHSFRPPYYHRNLMSEYMGLISGSYDAKPKGFLAGGGTLHNCMSPHGPDSEAFRAASQGSDSPEKYKDVLAFMFESHRDWRISREALESPLLQDDYSECWQGLESHFSARA